MVLISFDKRLVIPLDQRCATCDRTAACAVSGAMCGRESKYKSVEYLYIKTIISKCNYNFTAEFQFLWFYN